MATIPTPSTILLYDDFESGLGNWDEWDPGGTGAITNVRSHSPTQSYGCFNNYAQLGAAIVGNINEGYLDFWHYNDNVSHRTFSQLRFRASTIGLADNYCYVLNFPPPAAGSISLLRLDGVLNPEVFDAGVIPALDDWSNYRLYWWEDKIGAVDCTCFAIEFEGVAMLLTAGSGMLSEVGNLIVGDPARYRNGEATQRTIVGVGVVGAPYNWLYTDDVTIGLIKTVGAASGNLPGVLKLLG